MTRDPDRRMAGENDGEYTEGGAEGPSEVHSITSAAPGHSVDMHQRMVRYSLAMGIRMVCILALFFLDGWFKLIAVAGAVFLPWIAVVIANAQTKGESFDSELLDHVSYGELGTGYVEDDDTVHSAAETIQGEMIDDDPAAPSEGAHRQTDSEKEHPRDPEAGAA